MLGVLRSHNCAPWPLQRCILWRVEKWELHIGQAGRTPRCNRAPARPRMYRMGHAGSDNIGQTDIVSPRRPRPELDTLRYRTRPHGNRPTWKPRSHPARRTESPQVPCPADPNEACYPSSAAGPWGPAGQGDSPRPRLDLHVLRPEPFPRHGHTTKMWWAGGKTCADTE